MNIDSLRGIPSTPAPRPMAGENGGIQANRSNAEASARTAPQGNEPPPVERKQLEDAVGRIKEFVQPINDSIQFSLDEDSGRTVVKVVDLQTNEVIRQIPTEEALTIAKALDKLQGLLFQSKA